MAAKEAAQIWRFAISRLLGQEAKLGAQPQFRPATAFPPLAFSDLIT
jgi:hypothetical protein